MAIKTILSIVGAKQAGDDLDLALELCRASGAHLSVLVLSIAVPPPASEYAAVLSEAWLEERQLEVERLEARIRDLAEILAASEISADVTGEYVERSWSDDLVGRRGRYADIALIGPELASDRALQTIVLKGVLYESQVPVFLVPETDNVTLTPRCVMVAWDARPEAARAVREALPLLVGAEKVHIAMVDPSPGEEENGPEPGVDIAAYLARHGARVTVDRLPGMGRSVADTLRIHAVDVAADLIVMGAYGHSRLRERIFGGVTRSMIEEPPLPIFMAR